MRASGPHLGLMHAGCVLAGQGPDRVIHRPVGHPRNRPPPGTWIMGLLSEGRCCTDAPPRLLCSACPCGPPPLPRRFPAFLGTPRGVACRLCVYEHSSFPVDCENVHTRMVKPEQGSDGWVGGTGAMGRGTSYMGYQSFEGHRHAHSRTETVTH